MSPRRGCEYGRLKRPGTEILVGERLRFYVIEKEHKKGEDEEQESWDAINQLGRAHMQIGACGPAVVCLRRGEARKGINRKDGKPRENPRGGQESRASDSQDRRLDQGDKRCRLIRQWKK